MTRPVELIFGYVDSVPFFTIQSSTAPLVALLFGCFS